MNENIMKFLVKVSESEELQAKFAALATPEEAYELAKTIQDGFTKEEFLEAAAEIAAEADGDISDEALATAAGGTDEPVDMTVKSRNPLSAFSNDPTHWVTCGGGANVPPKVTM